MQDLMKGKRGLDHGRSPMIIRSPWGIAKTLGGPQGAETGLHLSGRSAGQAASSRWPNSSAYPWFSSLAMSRISPASNNRVRSAPAPNGGVWISWFTPSVFHRQE